MKITYVAIVLLIAAVLLAQTTVSNGPTYGGTVTAPSFTGNGTTAGFADFGQGSTSSAVAPCNASTSICIQAPTSVTSYLLTMPGAAPAVSNSLKLTSSAGVETYNATLPKAADPNAGIHNYNSAQQQQTVVSATAYYITSSDLDMPAVYNTAIGAGTAFKWRVGMNKTNAGTGTFQIVIYQGTNGTTSDTARVTQTIGTQTAVVDSMTVDVTVVFTSATAMYWSIVPMQRAATATGFGVATGATGQFSGTVTGLTTTTASDKWGLGWIATTGVPVITIPTVEAEAYGVN